MNGPDRTDIPEAAKTDRSERAKRMVLEADPYTIELETWYDVITQNLQPKTTIEDYKQDLKMF